MDYKIIKPTCIWYKQALYESQLDDERLKLWEHHLNCGGINKECEHYDTGNIENKITEIETQISRDKRFRQKTTKDDEKPETYLSRTSGSDYVNTKT